MVVSGRSYGMSSMIVNRGPQLVQLVKAYPCRRFPGVRMSLTHSVQVAASGAIGWYSPSTARTLHDVEPALAGNVDRGHVDRLDTRETRRIRTERRRERLDHRRLALDLDDHRTGGVAHPAAQLHPAGEVPDERAEPHPLHDAVHREPPALARTARRRFRQRRARVRWVGRDGHRITPRAGAP